MQELVERRPNVRQYAQPKEGDCVMFLQGRMMHGRDAFTEESAVDTWSVQVELSLPE
jgi:hypothetical protein